MERLSAHFGFHFVQNIFLPRFIRNDLSENQASFNETSALRRQFRISIHFFFQYGNNARTRIKKLKKTRVSFGF